MNKYYRLMKELDEGVELPSMKCFGNSMLPLLTNPSICFYKRETEYVVGDIVFCKVNGRFIDAHKIIAAKGPWDNPEYLIANNHGRKNGWTRTVYGRVVEAELKSGERREFRR